MFSKNLFRSTSQVFPIDAGEPGRSAGPTLVSSRATQPVGLSNSRMVTLHPAADLVLIAARRCASFFAEAAVLVLVFGILDLLILKGRIDAAWIVGALAISLGLLAASIATDFSAQRWIKAHP